MIFLVYVKRFFVSETFPAFGTREWTLARVTSLVSNKVSFEGETFPPLGAGEGALTVSFLMFVFSERYSAR